MKGGGLYFAAVFPCAFLIGMVRVLVLTPALGKSLAVCIELPIVLAISWLASRYLVSRFGIDGLSPRLGMGGLAFTLTMLAEMALSKVLLGQGPVLYLEGFGNMAAVLGLLGQLAFAFVPAVQLAFRRA